MTTKINFKGSNDAEATKRRKDLGKWLQAARTVKGWTQVEAAKKLGYEWYTFVSQVECGHARIPTDAWEHWARVYELDIDDFVMRLLKAYDPSLLKIVLRLKGAK